MLRVRVSPAAPCAPRRAGAFEGSSNGRTADFGSAYVGSSPAPSAERSRPVGSEPDIPSMSSPALTARPGRSQWGMEEVVDSPVSETGVLKVRILLPQPPALAVEEVMAMKLSEALALRADTQKRIMQLRARLQASALVQARSIVMPSIVTRVQGTGHRHNHVLADRFVERVGQGHVRPIASSPSGQGAALIRQRSCVRFAPGLPCAARRSSWSIRLPVRMRAFQSRGVGSTPACSTVAMV